jgi:hypothetical protein
MQTRHATPRTGRLRRRIGLIIALVAGLCVSTLGGAPAALAVGGEVGVPTTYDGQSYASSVVRPSENKPQSKLWFLDGSWWALMVSAGGQLVRIHELMPDHTWRDTGVTVDDRVDGTGDALWSAADGKLFVATRSKTANLKVARFSYDTVSRTWSGDAGFPVAVTTGGSESATIDRDSTGRLWVTYTRSSRIWVAHSDPSGLTWTAGFMPNVPDVVLKGDDLSTLIAFGTSMGVMWSDQQSGAFRFAIHEDGDPDNVWRVEDALSGPNLADDHLNIKQLSGDAQGRLFAAVKTSVGDVAGVDPNSTQTLVLVRTPGPGGVGAWSEVPAGTVADDHTRPILMIDQTNQELYFIATAPVTGGDIYYKKTSLANPSFAPGRGAKFVDSSALVNNASGSKDPVTAQTGMVVLAVAEGQKRYVHAEMALAGGGAPPADTTAPNVPTGLTATPAAGQVDLSWTASTDNVGVTGYTVFRDGVELTAIPGTSYTDTAVTAGQSYSYTVQAVDAAANKSAQSSPPVTALVPAAAGDTTPPSVPTGLAATPAAGQVGLSWTASTDDVGVTGYTVRRGGAAITTVPGTSFTDTAVTAGQTYSYTVEALDAAANASGQSAPPVSATVPVPPAGAPIALRAVTTAANNAENTITVPAPASQPGDVLLASIDFRGQPTITAPAGWTLLRQDNNGTAVRKATYWRVAGASEPASHQWRFSTKPSAVASISAYSGVSTTSPIQVSAGQINASSKSIATPSVVTTSAGAVVVRLVGVARLTSLTPPPGTVERSEIASPAAASFPVTAASADATQAAAGASGAVSATAAVAAPGVGQTVALNPKG